MRLARGVLLGSAVAALLSACESRLNIIEPPHNAWLAQSWTITEASPVEATTDAAPLGRTVNLSQSETSSVDGQICSYADILFSESPLTQVLGGVMNDTLMDRTVQTVTFSCSGQPMGTYARVHGMVLVTRSGPWLLWLKPSKSVVTIPILNQTRP